MRRAAVKAAQARAPTSAASVSSRGSGRGDVVVGHLMRGQAGQQGKTGGRVQVGGQLGGVLVRPATAHRHWLAVPRPHDPPDHLTSRWRQVRRGVQVVAERGERGCYGLGRCCPCQIVGQRSRLEPAGGAARPMLRAHLAGEHQSTGAAHELLGARAPRQEGFVQQHQDQACDEVELHRGAQVFGGDIRAERCRRSRRCPGSCRPRHIRRVRVTGGRCCAGQDRRGGVGLACRVQHGGVCVDAPGAAQAGRDGGGDGFLAATRHLAHQQCLAQRRPAGGEQSLVRGQHGERLGQPAELAAGLGIDLGDRAAGSAGRDGLNMVDKFHDSTPSWVVPTLARAASIAVRARSPAPSSSSSSSAQLASIA